MLIDIPLTNLGFSDLNIIQAGMEDCERGHSFGPAVREFYLIHYILQGEGVFKSKGKEYRLTENQGFLISPREITYYKASINNPWTYVWIGFNGIRALELLEQAGLSLEQPIINSSKCRELFELIENTTEMQSGKELFLLSILFRFFSVLSKSTTAVPKNYANKAAGYITSSIGMEIKIASIAKMLGLDRRYFCQVFKQEYGISPQQYLVKVRMETAKSLLSGTALSISDISRSVGYTDPLGFSKIFKRYFGVSPSKFRK